MKFTLEKATEPNPEQLGWHLNIEVAPEDLGRLVAKNHLNERIGNVNLNIWVREPEPNS